MPLVTAFPRAGRAGGRVPGPGERRAGPRVLALGELEARARRPRRAPRRRPRARWPSAARARGTRPASLLERMLLEPGRHRFVRVPQPRARRGRLRRLPASRPRLGLIGMLMGWWHVKLSSGCPLARPDGASTAVGRRSRKRSGRRQPQARRSRRAADAPPPPPRAGARARRRAQASTPRAPGRGARRRPGRRSRSSSCASCVGLVLIVVGLLRRGDRRGLLLACGVRARRRWRASSWRCASTSPATARTASLLAGARRVLRRASRCSSARRCPAGRAGRRGRRVRRAPSSPCGARSARAAAASGSAPEPAAATDYRASRRRRRAGAPDGAARGCAHRAAPRDGDRRRPRADDRLLPRHARPGARARGRQRRRSRTRGTSGSATRRARPDARVLPGVPARWTTAAAGTGSTHHFALRASARREELDAWRDYLRSRGVAVHRRLRPRRLALDLLPRPRRPHPRDRDAGLSRASGLAGRARHRRSRPRPAVRR